MKTKLLIPILVLLISTVTFGQSFELFDFNTNGDFEPKNFTEFNGLLIFQARGSNGDVELWKSDGTLSGTELIKDLDANQSSAPRNFFEFNGFLYFVADNSASVSASLWRTDGTEAGTTLITNQVAPQGLYAIANNLLFFVGDDATSGKELWVTDGTTSGTNLVKDINAGSWDALQFNSPLISYNNMIIFSPNNGIDGKELWKSDGTEAGTEMIKDIDSGSDSSTPIDFIEYKSKIYFTATTLPTGRELWKTDGTESGTVMVEDNFAGEDSSNPAKFVVYSESLFFQAESDDNKGIEMHRYNLTTNAVQRVADIYDGEESGGFSPAIEYNEGLYFTASKPATGIELYVRRNGSNTFAEDSFPGSGSGGPSAFCNCGDKMYYRAYDGNQNSLFEFDTSGNATIISPSSAVNEPFFTSIITELFCFNNALYLAANYTNSGYDLWKYTDTTLSVKNESISDLNVSIFPNPASTIVNLKLEGSGVIKNVEIYNLIGKRVLLSSEINSTNTHLDISSLNAGVYFVKVKGENHTYSKKIIIK